MDEFTKINKPVSFFSGQTLCIFLVHTSVSNTYWSRIKSVDVIFPWFLGRISGIIVAGGDGHSAVDFLTEDLGIKQLPNLPQKIHGSSMFAHNGTIILSGHSEPQM